MTIPRILGALALSIGLAACASPEVTRNSATGLGALDLSGGRADTAAPEALVPGYRVTEVRVFLPRELVVSEANVYFPLGDIIWHGDAEGDRREQVRAILADGLNDGARALAAAAGRADLPTVTLEAELTRFHALTPIARSTMGGLHTVVFNITLRDARTGALIDGPRPLRMDIPAAGGARARAEDAQGLTQRVVIVRHIAGRILQELSVPAALDAPVSSRLEHAASPALLQPLR